VDQIKSLDLDELRRSYKNSRLRIQSILQNKDDLLDNTKVSPIRLDIGPSCWCSRCIEFYDHCIQQICLKNRLEIIGGLFTKQILYKCHSKDHIFCVSSVRKHKHQTQYKIEDYSCPDCKKEDREDDKKKAQIEEQL
jgi:hypothetical protein